ncbi:MAG TPA: hypothetical protein VFA21_07260, partial [Pyrinomonadaceae bacterium]|nr:hypothetical protein [Pyrinomonadaceae bacterium]
VNSFRWSGLASHVTLADLSSLATDYSRNYATGRIKTFGLLSRVRSGSTAANSATTNVMIRPRRSEDVDERLLDRLDPSTQLARLSRFLMRTRRLASLRGRWMYFYTDVRGGHGLVGVNIESGRAERVVRLNDPDERFISDETEDLLYFSKGDRMIAYRLDERY